MFKIQFPTIKSNTNIGDLSLGVVEVEIPENYT